MKEKKRLMNERSECRKVMKGWGSNYCNDDMAQEMRHGRRYAHGEMWRDTNIPEKTAKDKRHTRAIDKRDKEVRKNCGRRKITENNIRRTRSRLKQRKTTLLVEQGDRPVILTELLSPLP